jgi:hypothetical protein
VPEPIALRAVFGQDEANHGTTRYRVDGDGLVHVPREAVPFLTSTGGFAVEETMAARVSEAQRPSTDRSSLVRLHHDTAAGCSYGGDAYWSDDNGDVLVPAEAVADLLGHGFVPVPRDESRGDAAAVPKVSKLAKSAPGAKPPPAMRPAKS